MSTKSLMKSGMHLPKTCGWDEERICADYHKTSHGIYRGVLLVYRTHISLVRITLVSEAITEWHILLGSSVKRFTAASVFCC